MFYTYIVYSKKLGKKYVGYCTDLKNRIKEHNRGESRLTSRGAPWKLIYYEVFLSKIDAMNEEKFLKTGKGRERLKIFIK